MSDFRYVCDYYGVPACYGRSVKVDGRPGIITKDRGAYIGVTFDDDKATSVSPCHPTWKVEYGDIRQPRKLTRSQIRYQRYKDVADCFDSFLDFCRYEAAKGQP